MTMTEKVALNEEVLKELKVHVKELKQNVERLAGCAVQN